MATETSTDGVYTPGIYTKGESTKFARSASAAVALAFEGYTRQGDLPEDESEVPTDSDPVENEDQSPTTPPTPILLARPTEKNKDNA